MFKLIVQSLCHFFNSLNCLHCLNTLSPGDRFICLKCRYEIEPFWNGFWSVKNKIDYLEKPCQPIHICFRYRTDSPIQSLIKNWKYRNQPEIGNYLFELYLSYGSLINDLTLENSVLCMVPLHQNKMKKRGYNQCLGPAKKWATRFKIELISDLLTKTSRGDNNAELNRSERLENTKGFKLNPKYVKSIQKWKQVIILDDLITTGSTLRQAAQCIQNQGQKNIFFLVMASSID